MLPASSSEGSQPEQRTPPAASAPIPSSPEQDSRWAFDTVTAVTSVVGSARIALDNVHYLETQDIRTLPADTRHPETRAPGSQPRPSRHRPATLTSILAAH